MPYIAPIRSDLKETTRQKTTKKIRRNKNFTTKTEYLNLKAYSNNVKTQSDKTLTTQIYVLLTIHRTESFLSETMLQVNKEKSLAIIWILCIL